MSSERFLSKRTQTQGATDDRRKMLAIAATMDNVINLGRGDPDLETPDYVIQAVKQDISKAKTHYTAWAGLPELRKVVAEKFARENGFCPGEDEIIVTVGAQEAIFLTMMGLLDPGDEVIVPEPRYTPYDTCVKLAGGVLVNVPTYEEYGFKVRVEDIEKAITPRTKAILLVSPNNPTGAVLDRETLEKVASLAQEKDLVVISDELYQKLVFDDVTPVSMASLPNMFERTVTVSGISKTYSMTGWRIGFMIAPREIISPILALKYAVTICAPAISQYAALAALTGPQEYVQSVRDIYQERREVTMKCLDELHIPYTKPQGTFYLFMNIKKFGMSSFEFASSLLKETGVFTFPGTAFGAMGEGYIRLSLLVPSEKIKEAFDRVGKYLEAHNLQR